MTADSGKISVIVVNWNGREHLPRCLDSLQSQSYGDVEVILVDNASTDGSVEFVESNFPFVHIIRNSENLGYGAAVNRGLQKANGAYYLFLNDDLYLDRDCLKELVGPLSEKVIGAVVPKILYSSRPDYINSFGVDVNFLGLAWPRHINELDSGSLEMRETPCGGIFMLRRNTIEAIGTFDEDLFLYHEDHDLSWRIRLVGYKIVVNPKARLYHKYHFNKSLDKFYHSEKNRVHLLLKHYEARTLFLILPALLIVEVAEIYFALFSGWVSKKMWSYFEIASEMTRIVAKRRAIQSSRKVNDRVITRLFSGNLRIGGMSHFLLDNCLSPFLNLYWNLIKGMI